MKGIDWKSKLTSRKFWLSIVGFVGGIIIAFKGNAGLVETVSGCIMSGAAVVAYIIGEGLIDREKQNGEDSDKKEE